jgi:serine/threonine-protein kinase
MDIWALGCVLFEMIAGRGPFAGGTLVEVVAAVQSPEPAPRLSTLAAAVPPKLEKLVGWMLEKDVAKRVPAMAIVTSELRSLQKALDAAERAAEVDNHSTQETLLGAVNRTAPDESTGQARPPTAASEAAGGADPLFFADAPRGNVEESSVGASRTVTPARPTSPVARRWRRLVPPLAGALAVSAAVFVVAHLRAPAKAVPATATASQSVTAYSVSAPETPRTPPPVAAPIPPAAAATSASPEPALLTSARAKPARVTEAPPRSPLSARSAPRTQAGPSLDDMLERRQ